MSPAAEIGNALRRWARNKPAHVRAHVAFLTYHIAMAMRAPHSGFLRRVVMLNVEHLRAINLQEHVP